MSQSLPRRSKRQRQQQVEFVDSAVGPDITMSDAASGPGPGGRTLATRAFRPANRLYSKPKWQVPKWQYNRLKNHILSKTKYQRYNPYYRRPGNYNKSSGPIVITGRGGYFTDKLRSGASAAYRAIQRGVPKGTFERLGTAAGGAMFGKYGAQLGGIAGKGIAGITGFGDYQIIKNDMLDEGMLTPTFTDLNHGITVCHREYIKDIVAPAIPSLFNLESFPINPGISKTFPWLSQIANMFDQYEITGMVFHFKSTSSDFGTSTNLAMGTVVLATDYDANDSTYASKVEMENAQYSVSTKPSVDIIHAVECDPSISFSPLKYIRTGGVPSGKDPRLYDHGIFQIATQGLPTGSSGSIGELWCSYKVNFYKPQISGYTGVPTDIVSSPGTGISAGTYFGVGATLTANSSLGGSINQISTYTFPANVVVGSIVQMTYSVLGTNTVIAANMNYTALQGLQPLHDYQLLRGTGQTSQVQIASWIMQVTASPASITLTAGTVPTSPVGMSFVVTTLDGDVKNEIPAF